MTTRRLWLLLSVVLVFAAAVFARQFWVTDSYYLKAASTVVPEAPAQHAAKADNHNDVSGGRSQQPKPFGLLEKEMHKNKADGYSVY